MVEILHVVGARPNMMKVAPVWKELARYPEVFPQRMVHTGQHSDANMSLRFFEELGLPPPVKSLGVPRTTQIEWFGKTMAGVELVFREEVPDLVIVYGDVDSTLLATLTAKKLGFSVAHVEAGLRSFDRTMPEELNRVLVDQMSDLLFVPSLDAVENLQREGVAREKIHFVGNVMIDTLVEMEPVWMESGIPGELGLEEKGQIKPFILATFHRPSNVDDRDVFLEIVSALWDLAEEGFDVVFPIHPRTKDAVAASYWPQTALGGSRVHLVEPLGYLDFLKLESAAAAVVTDSGGVQEETTYLRVPCVTVRPNTERPVTIYEGTNTLVPSNRKSIVAAVQSVIGTNGTNHPPPTLWDGRAAQRIAHVLLGHFRTSSLAHVSAP